MAITKPRLSADERREFCDAYLRHREGGLKVKSAYQAARAEMARDGKPIPEFATFQGWLYKRRPDELTPSDQSDRSDQSDAPAPVPAPAPDDSVLLKLLRLYRYRREQDIDAIVDALIPDLAD